MKSKPASAPKRFPVWQYVIALLLIIATLCGITLLLNACKTFLAATFRLLLQAESFYLCL
jgi:hypothetical protein